MENSTGSFYFRFTMFGNMGNYQYPVFVFCLLLYGFIISANLVIILVVFREKSLHEPMYIFIAVLSINSLLGSAGFFPRFLVDLLLDTHLISRPGCYTQTFVIYLYACCEMTILGIMAYDRYIAVCKPLHYHTHMTFKTICNLLAIAGLFPAFALTVILSLSAVLPLCGNEIPKVYCANWNIVKLACVRTVINNLVGMTFTIAIVFLPLFFVLYTYLRIIMVCWRKSEEFKQRVFQSCLPHIVSFVVYSIIGFCDITLSRLDPKDMNQVVYVLLSLEFVCIPPVINPLVYGLKLPQIRQNIIRLIPMYKQ